MRNFDYQTPTRLIFGKGVVEKKLKSVMAKFGKRVLITYGGGSIKRSGLYDQVLQILEDKEIYELPGIEPNPKFNPSVLDGVRICKEKDIDVILAVGGGSVLDCTKAIDGAACSAADPSKSLVKNVQIVLGEPDNYNARAEIFYATTLGCNGIYSLGNSESGWPMHAIEHALSGHYDITHGEGLAIVTPRWMRHILNNTTGELHDQVVERITWF